MKLIGIAADLGHAVRTLRREPGFALPAILILGLGLGGTAAGFSLVNGVLLKPLPYAQPDRLVTIREVIPQIAHLYPTLPVNARHFVEWRKECRSLQRSEEHTSELQSPCNLVCRLLLEKKQYQIEPPRWMARTKSPAASRHSLRTG